MLIERQLQQHMQISRILLVDVVDPRKDLGGKKSHIAVKKVASPPSDASLLG